MGEESGEQCAVRVICRFRPLNAAESSRGDQDKDFKNCYILFNLIENINTLSVG